IGASRRRGPGAGAIAVRVLVVRRHDGPFDVSSRAFLVVGWRRVGCITRPGSAWRRAFRDVLAGEVFAGGNSDARIGRRGPCDSGQLLPALLGASDELILAAGLEVLDREVAVGIDGHGIELYGDRRSPGILAVLH